jgi:predicted dehydrogenase
MEGPKMLQVGIVGYGYWGPNLARNFAAHDGCRVLRIADKDEGRRHRAQSAHPGADITDRDISADSDLDVIAVATPVSSHYEIAKSALENGKHVWIEKPMTRTAEQADDLVRISEANGLMLMVDHTFLFTGAVRTLKELIDTGELGDLFYYDSVRVNLGLFQHDVNVIWDLAPHDLSIVDFLLGPAATSVAAHGRGHFGTGIEDVAYLTIYYPNDLIVHLHLNWLSPVKIRRTLIGGSKKMVVWDDLNREEQVKLYDKGMDVQTREGRYSVLATPRQGDMYSPLVPATEALSAEVSHFVDCIGSGEVPINDGRAGRRVVSILEATDRSLQSNGEIVEIQQESRN